MTKKRKIIKAAPEKIDRIISRHIVYSMTAGAIPVPLVDIAAVAAIQLDMIKQIARQYGKKFTQEAGKSIVTSLAGASIASSAGKIGASAVKVIPVVGTLLGVGTQAVISGASTYALGKAFDLHFSADGSIFDFNAESMKSRYDEFLEKGRKMAKNLYSRNKQENITETISKLKELQKDGVITKKEFEDTKKKLLEKITD